MPALLTGQFGRYQILRKLGEGGMGAVYLAEDTNMRRKVALKIPNFDGKESQTVIDRFYREARVAADIRHPGVCTVYDVGSHDGVHFLTMAYIEGTPLADIVRAGTPWPVAHAVGLVAHLADALHALHARGIVHRDLKPGNVMIEPSGRPVLLDFGLARSLQAASQMLTADGNSLGTPAYMAPEQVSGKVEAMGAWTDVYPLGIILFQLLTGKLPFQPVSMAELYALLLYAPRPRPSEFGVTVPAELDLLCQTAIAIEPRQRPADMPTFIARLQRSQHSLPAMPPPEMLPTQPEGFSTACPKCGKKVRITAAMTGKKVLCPGCRQILPTTPALAPVVLVEEVPERTEPIQSRRPQTRSLDTQPTNERTQRRPATQYQSPRRPPERGNSGLIWLIGALTLIGLPVVIGVGIWLAASGGTSSSATSAAVTMPKPPEEPKRFTNSIGMEFTWIPPGNYTMGSPVDEVLRTADEGPQHEVEIGTGFYFGVYEVTQEEFQKLLGTTPSSFRAGGASAAKVDGLDTQRLPVETLTWYEAERFCQVLSERPDEIKMKRRYRLPTEAEWEYACRGGSKTYQVYYTGSSLSSTQANFKASGFERPVAVDDTNYQPNPFGLYHMHGNVYEWCQDYHDAQYYQTCLNQSLRRDPPGPTTGTTKLVRGGCWYGDEFLCRSAARNMVNPGTGYIDVGFRVVCEKVP